MRKGVILLSMYALTAIGSCVCVFLWGNAHSEFTEGADGVIDIMAEPAASWFGTVVFAFCVILLDADYSKSAVDQHRDAHHKYIS